jgi:hypothetical protein
MANAWEVLEAAGVPVGAPRVPGEMPPDAELRQALRSAISMPASTASWEALRAWLSAFRQHWPRRFALGLGPEGAAALSFLGGRSFDANRYLKLRRIALAQLVRP